MSETLQKDTCYFSHDANAKDDYKCMLVIDQMGLEGYGIFWVLVETLREQKDYKYPLQLVPSLARKYNTTQAKMETVINAYGLFEIDAQSFFFSGSLNRRMSFLEQKREKLVAASLKGVEAKKAKKQQLLELSGYNSTNHRLTDGQPSKEKESKEKESKENKTLSQESEPERDIFKNLQSFKSHFISKNTNVPFYTNGIGYEPATPFKINESGYVVNMVSGKMITPDEALKIWEYLYNYYQNQKIGA